MSSVVQVFRRTAFQSVVAQQHGIFLPQEGRMTTDIFGIHRRNPFTQRGKCRMDVVEVPGVNRIVCRLCRGQYGVQLALDQGGQHHARHAA